VSRPPVSNRDPAASRNPTVAPDLSPTAARSGDELTAWARLAPPDHRQPQSSQPFILTA
jgi:hypothetical protein